MKRIVLTLAILLVFVLALVSCGGEPPITSSADTSQTAETTAAITTKDPSAAKYDEAFDLIAQGDDEAAYEIFKALGDYRDAKEQLGFFRYVPTKVVSQDYVYGNLNKAEFLYNGNNLPVKETHLHNGSVSYVYEYAFDVKGNMIEFKQHIPAYDQTTAFSYSYDDNGRIIKTKSMTGTDGDYRYDDNENLSEIIYTEGSVYLYRTAYLYDANGNLVKSFKTDKDGVESQVSEYFYDANGNLVKETYAMTGDLVDTVIEYSYNENGDLIHTVYDRGTENENGSEYTYDENRKQIQKTTTNARGQKTVYDYTYDENGNLVKMTTSKSGTVTETESYEYRLVYFPYTVSEQIESIIDIDNY